LSCLYLWKNKGKPCWNGASWKASPVQTCEEWRFHPVPPTQLVLGSHCARYIFSKIHRLCGPCPLYIYLYTVYLLWSMIQHCASLCVELVSSLTVGDVNLCILLLLLSISL
jgi:hypothetical protein